MKEKKQKVEKRRLFIVLALLSLLLWAVYSLPRMQCNWGSGPKVGQKALSFEVPSRQGKKIKLKDFEGKVLLINFWATWCGPCRQEMPSLEALYRRYQDQGFVVLGISLDPGGWEDISNFLKELPLSFPIAWDEGDRVSEQYQVFRIPETYLLDRKGVIRAKIVGPQNYNQKLFFQKVEKLLSEE